MAQMVLPVFTEGTTMISPVLGFEKRDGQVYYFHGGIPIFSHAEDDIKSFRMFVSQLVVNGNCKQADIVRAFGIPSITMKRSVKLYQEKGPPGFFEKRETVKNPRVLTPEVLEKAQSMLNEGRDRFETAKELGIKPDTFYRAIRDGKRLERPVDEKKNKSGRSIEDSNATMGKACTRTIERVAAATGKIECAQTRFDNLCDIKGGGVLLALPALLANGLLKFSDRFFRLPEGYYSLYNIFLLLGFMALARVKNVEQLRYTEPGEWDKILGLDRILEVRTLREKVGLLSEVEKSVCEWSCALAEEWMKEDPQAAGVLYVDGHVRVYHGSKNKLSRRYVSRQKLALRGVTDYWVNDVLGRPFFTVSSAFTTGLIAILDDEIVPRLCRDIPGQPDLMKLEADPYLSRFVLIFDREGYSPDFFYRMWEQRIACQTYQKYPKERWPEADFETHRVAMPHGEMVEMELAERGLLLGEKIWVREIRRKCRSGHQSISFPTKKTRRC